jgi:hypothetical protein
MKLAAHWMSRRLPWLPKILRWTGVSIAGLVLLVIALAYLADEPLRRKIEADLNHSLKGYTVRIERVDFHPLGFSLDLENSIISQNEHPDPPVAYIPNLTASVEWRALLFGNLVADFRIDRPKIYINRRQAKKEIEDAVPIKERGWQEALEAIYPLKVDRFVIDGAEVTYIDEGPFRPLHFTHLDFHARNIRNVRAPEQPYPSEVQLKGNVFQKGKVVLDGHANFLAEPHVAFKAQVTLDQVELDYFKPIIQRQNFLISGGTLSGAGHMEYAAKTKSIEIPKLTVRGTRAEYIQKSETPVTKKVAKKVDEKTKKYSDEPTLQFKLHQLHVAESEIGFVNRTKQPEYRVFLSNADLQIKNLTNESEERPAVGSLKGRFMGSGDMRVNVSFHANPKGPDMNMEVAIEDTDMRAMNDLFRAYGNFDVVAGVFSFYSEIAVRNGLVNGYVKPIFKDMDVYDHRQEREKNVFRKLYEGLIGGLSWLLRNPPREEVATTTTVSGKLSDPRTSTLEVVLGLVQNAFFKSILPGFEREVSSRGGRGPTAKSEPASVAANDNRDPGCCPAAYR